MERQFKAFLQAIQKRLVKRFKVLQANPRPPGIKKLAGEDNPFRAREGSFRIIYRIRDKELIVLVLKNGAWKEVYRS